MNRSANECECDFSRLIMSRHYPSPEENHGV